MVTNYSDGNRGEIPDSMVRSAIRLAERQAILVAIFLQSLAPEKSHSWKLPASALLELGAVLELQFWESQDYRRHLDSDLPSSKKAMVAFARRCIERPSEFGAAQPELLSSAVLRVWLSSFSWDGPDILGAEAELGDADDDWLLDIVAEFVWTHRHDLACLRGKEDNS